MSKHNLRHLPYARVGQAIEIFNDKLDDFVPGVVKKIDGSNCTVAISDISRAHHDLAKLDYKSCFEVGSTDFVDPKTFVGSYVEVMQHNLQYLRGFVKKANIEIDCNLILYDNGKKDWVDLSLVNFKLLRYGAQLASEEESDVGDSSSRSERIQQQQEHQVEQVKQQSVEAIIPPWYLDEHVEIEIYGVQDEIMDVFLLDSISSKGIMKLANDDGQYIEVVRNTTPHKVVKKQGWAMAHSDTTGELVGHVIDVIDEEHSTIVTGKVLEVSRLYGLNVLVQQIMDQEDPILHWVDLSVNGLKIHAELNPPKERHLSRAQSGSLAPIQQPKVLSRIQSSPVVRAKPTEEATSRTTDKPTNQSSPVVHAKPNEEATSRTTEKPTNEPGAPGFIHSRIQVPVLAPGQRIEIIHPETQAYVKGKITQCATHPVYTVSFSEKSLSPIEMNLDKIKCKLQLGPQFRIARELLGHKVDVYQRETQSVETGMIRQVNDEMSSILVRFLTSSVQPKAWIDYTKTKVKLRLAGEQIGSSKSGMTKTLSRSDTFDGKDVVHRVGTLYTLPSSSCMEEGEPTESVKAAPMETTTEPTSFVTPSSLRIDTQMKEDKRKKAPPVGSSSKQGSPGRKRFQMYQRAHGNSKVPEKTKAVGSATGSATAGFWYQYLDPVSNLPYWVHGLSGQSSWDPPIWTKELDVSSNAEYYLNSKTGESQWEEPKEFEPIVPSADHTGDSEQDKLVQRKVKKSSALPPVGAIEAIRQHRNIQQPA